MRDSYGWNAQNSLGEKFLSFLRELQTHLERRKFAMLRKVTRIE